MGICNLKKDLAAGYDEVVFCVANEPVKERLETEFSKALPEWRARASIVLLESFTEKKK